MTKIQIEPVESKDPEIKRLYRELDTMIESHVVKIQERGLAYHNELSQERSRIIETGRDAEMRERLEEIEAEQNSLNTPVVTYPQGKSRKNW